MFPFPAWIFILAYVYTESICVGRVGEKGMGGGGGGRGEREREVVVG